MIKYMNNKSVMQKFAALGELMGAPGMTPGAGGAAGTTPGGEGGGARRPAWINWLLTLARRRLAGCLPGWLCVRRWVCGLWLVNLT